MAVIVTIRFQTLKALQMKKSPNKLPLYHSGTQKKQDPAPNCDKGRFVACSTSVHQNQSPAYGLTYTFQSQVSHLQPSALGAVYAQ